MYTINNSQAKEFYLESDGKVYWIYDAAGYSETCFIPKTQKEAEEVFNEYISSNPHTKVELLKSDRIKGNAFCVDILYFTTIQSITNRILKSRMYRIIHNRETLFSEHCENISEEAVFEKYESIKKEILGN